LVKEGRGKKKLGTPPKGKAGKSKGGKKVPTPLKELQVKGGSEKFGGTKDEKSAQRPAGAEVGKRGTEAKEKINPGQTQEVR